MSYRKITRDEVEIVLRALPEHETKNEHIVWGRKYGVWGWFCAHVIVTWNGYKGEDFLGGCSYESEEAFRADAYFDDMVSNALDGLNEYLERKLNEALETASFLKLSLEEIDARRRHYGGVSWNAADIWCPACNADLRDHLAGAPFLRRISISDRETTPSHQCPDCNHVWPCRPTPQPR